MIIFWLCNSSLCDTEQFAQVESLSRVRLLATPWTVAYQALPSMGFSRQEYWSGVPLPSPESVKMGCFLPWKFQLRSQN